MNSCEWIVCERTDRWATALRVAAARHANWLAVEPRVYEVRSLDALAARLEARPDALGFINVHQENLPRVLTWLVAARANYPQARFMALLDCRPTQQEVADSLFEAGAADIAHSPRQLRHLLPLARQHAAIAAARPIAPSADNSLRDSIWSSLPWQPGERPVG